MAKLRDRRDEANAPTALCRKEFLHVQKNLVAAPERLKATSARAVAVTKD